MIIIKISKLIRIMQKYNSSRYKQDISINEVMQILRTEKDVILLDVRSEQEYNENHLKGAILIPSYEIGSKASRILKNKQSIIILYCKSGIRSKKALQELKRMGYKNLYNLRGGLEEI